nr:hypothetical protein [Tanacetum cinerariifolium]
MTKNYQGFKDLALTPSSSVPQITLAIIKRPLNVRGDNDTHADTKEPPSHTEGKHVTIEDDTKKHESNKAKEEPTRAVSISIIRPTTRPNPEERSSRKLKILNSKSSRGNTLRRNNDKRNFDVHNLFKFGDFKITELDELGPIIEKKKNSIIKDLMTSVGKRYEILNKIPEELRNQSAIPAPIPKQAPS